MTDSPPVSAYIRTLNEARMIGEVVRAARAATAEVIVVDSGSTDATVAIARETGAQVLAQPWLGNGLQKRAGEDACRFDWVLDLDADEVVTPELAAEIAALFAAGPRETAYSIPLLTQPPFGRLWRRAAVARRTKLYDRRVWRMPAHKAWDQLDTGAARIGRLRGAIVHHSFRDVAHMADKLNKVSTVRARETRLKPYGVVVLRVIAAGPLYFLRHWLLRGLWREGLYGFAVSVLAAHGRWLRDVKMLERHWRADDQSR